MKYSDKFNLSKKFAIVVGGAGLIGKEVVYALYDAGATVLILDINYKVALEVINNTSKSKVFFKKIDLSDVDCLEKLYEILKEVDKLVFINCSYRPATQENKCFNKMKFQYFRSVVDMHLNSFAG